MSQPEWPEFTVADFRYDEQARLMPCPRAFDGYVKQPVRMWYRRALWYRRVAFMEAAS